MANCSQPQKGPSLTFLEGVPVSFVAKSSRHEVFIYAWTCGPRKMQRTSNFPARIECQTFRPHKDELKRSDDMWSLERYACLVPGLRRIIRKSKRFCSAPTPSILQMLNLFKKLKVSSHYIGRTWTRWVATFFAKWRWVSEILETKSLLKVETPQFGRSSLLNALKVPRAGINQKVLVGSYF